MKYFNGFSLLDEEELFSEYLSDGSRTVVGFSYGAQKAFEYAHTTSNYVDRLILLSPAFFQMEKKSFARTQLRYFESDKKAYIDTFLQNASYPSSFELSIYKQMATKEDLEALLTYVWDAEKIDHLKLRGTTIEVFLGMEDKIIDAKMAESFFSKCTTTYSIKGVGHILREV
ncbi:MAG: pimelyl-ACP methyl ester esterase BioV [Campylobacterota bacterium]|nr:pimelyl-ACP methyl ester esterase BioV [Campylobacterota bacterium]